MASPDRTDLVNDEPTSMEMKTTQRNYWSALEDNESYLYPRKELVSIGAIVTSSSPPGLSITFVSDLPETVKSYVVRVAEPRSTQEITDTLTVSFESNSKTEAQRRLIKIDVLGHDGSVVVTKSINVSFYPPELYAKNGRISDGAIVIEASDIPVLESRVDDWIYDIPTEDDIRFARNTWGSKIIQETTSRGKAWALAKILLEDLEDHRGIPSDEQSKAEPLDQYRRAVSGQDRVWCDNLSKIFVRAANSLGLKTRFIALSGKSLENEGIPVFLVDGHTTTEFFDEENNQWVWLDMTAHTLGARLADVGFLNVIQFSRSFNDPNISKHVNIVLYDAKIRTLSDIPVLTDGPKQALQTFFKKGQRYNYVHAVDEE